MSKIVEYTREPCPICGHKGWCGQRSDSLVLCKRPPPPGDVPGFAFKGVAKDGMTGMYIEVGKEYVQPCPQSGGEHSRRAECSRTETPAAPAKVKPVDNVNPKWLTENYPRLAANFTEERRAALAEALSLPYDALDALAIGWWPDRRWWNPDTRQHEGEPGCWTFPEYDAHDRIIGLGLRWPMGQKGQLTGGRRGLTLPVGWRERQNPVLIVEGPSDVLAGSWLHLNVIGRPSTSGGVELLTHVCRNRRTIVLGENDRKPDGRWPGKEGAEAVAAKLTTAWSRPVPVAYPPHDFKDLRDWFVIQHGTVIGQMDAAERATFGEDFIKAIAPPDIVLQAGPRTRRGGKVAVRAFRWTDPVDAGPFFTDKLDLENAKHRTKFAAAVAEAEPSADVEVVQKQLIGLKAPDPQPRRREAAIAQVCPPVAAISATDRSETTRPHVQGNERQLRDIRADALAALLGSNEPPRLFARSGGIARVALVQDDQDQAVPQIQLLDADALRGELTNAADWFTLHHSKERGDYHVPDLPPLAAARDILALPAVDLPPLLAIITCPTFAANGSLIAAGGYDQASGLWHHLTLTDLEAIPENPSREEIAASRDAFADVVAEFPFTDAASRANTLALMLLPFVRPLIDGPTPLHAIDAPTPGTGKGLLVQACLWPALGYGLDIRSGARDPDEWRKRITSELVAGKPAIGFDNATTRLDSEHLAAALTATMWTDRVLGQTRVVTIPNRSIWVCTGNNLAFSKELARRVVWIRLDAKVEAPEQRTGFRYPNLTAHVRERRGALVAAALTLCRAWLAADRPPGKQVMGSFESYAGTLGGILDLAGVEGFLANAEELRRQADSETSEWRAFVHAWWERRRDAWVGVSDLAELLWETDGKRTDLLPTVVNAPTQRGAVTQLGRRLSAKRDCVISSRRLLADANQGSHGRLAYRLLPTEKETSGSDPESLPEVSLEVSGDKLPGSGDLRRQGDFRRPSGHPHLYAGANKNAPSYIPRASNSPAHTRGMQKKSTKVSSTPQSSQSQALTSGDFVGDFQETLSDGQESLPRCHDMATGVDSVPAGWSTLGWITRLRQLADRCEDIQPDLAVQHRAEADQLEKSTAVR